MGQPVYENVGQLHGRQMVQEDNGSGVAVTLTGSPAAVALCTSGTSSVPGHNCDGTRRIMHPQIRQQFCQGKEQNTK